MAQATVAVTVNRRDFERGVRYAKSFGGQFDGAAKLWHIAADRPELGTLASYGLSLATPVVTLIQIRTIAGTPKTLVRTYAMSAEKRAEFESFCAEKGARVLDWHELRGGSPRPRFCTTCEGACDNSHPDY